MERGVCRPCLDKETCTSCPSGFLLHNYTCITSCPNRWYNDAGWCRECNVEGCDECIGPNDCLSCSPGLRLHSPTSCLSVCPPHSFPSPTSNTCSRCHHFCNDCFGEGPYSCLSCAAGRYLDAAAKLCLPCHQCNSTNQHQCCQCDPTTGLCHLRAGKRRIASGVGEDAMMADSSMIDERVSSALGGSSLSREPGASSSLTAAALGAGVALLLVSAVVFTVIQVRWWVRSRKMGYTKVPIYEVGFTDPLSFQKTCLAGDSPTTLHSHHALT